MTFIYGKWSGLTKNGKRLSIAMTALRRISAQGNYAGVIARQALKDCAAVKIDAVFDKIKDRNETKEGA